MLYIYTFKKKHVTFNYGTIFDSIILRQILVKNNYKKREEYNNSS